MPNPAGGTILAFDFGIKRIGVAVGDSGIGMAHPLTAIESEKNDARFTAIAALIAEWRPFLLLVGLPAADLAHDMTARCRRFGHQLKGRFGLPVAWVDERFTSVEAEAGLRAAGSIVKGRKGRIDTVSAQILLQSYFDGGDAVLVPHVPIPA